MRRLSTLTPAIALALVLAGCGGGGDGGVLAPDPDDGGATQQVGPFVIRTAATAGFQAQNIPNEGGAAFVALSGAKITYLGVQEMLDRIVFDDAHGDIHVCDLFGGNEAALTSNDANQMPVWSPDGSRIAYMDHSTGPGYVSVMDADGTGNELLYTSTCGDLDPSWHPSGLQIAFDSGKDGNLEIYCLNVDGSDVHNLTNDGAIDRDPDWALDGSGIYFDSNRDGTQDIYRMDDDGGNVTRLTNDSREDTSVCVSADGTRLAWARKETGGEWNIFVASADGSSVLKFTDTDDDHQPCFSSDGSLLVYSRGDGSQSDLWAKETAPPYREYQITDTASRDEERPDLGSPTPQIRRVLIGAAGADHGYDPLWPYVYAAIVAFDDTGYLNFLRIGIPSNDCDTIEVEPIPDTGDRLVGLRVEADNILNLREDQGTGEDPSWWNIVAESPSSVLLYLDAHTGKLVSVLLTRDTVYPAAAAQVEHTLDGSTLRVAGDVAAVYANGGELVAEDVGAV